ncbi:hypothetical protein Ade02nite_10940 [Paractinoplanes deccanensis]|uniref:STAS domain-containing protein n=1 Tax=Paractinoplanes deccanensis TaxID=113561 RepID=A0ABQ3XXH9_9ACTN|nr:STAS domain-containing protein [Actinoplanes deccanensis]GID72453.1 hypothetical protein Ade02nite_10940 [Actinoplanes deccanensis]
MTTIALPNGPTKADISFLSALVGAGEGDVVLDLSAVTQPTMIAIEALARLALAARHHGRRLTIHGARPELRELATLVGLETFLEPSTPAAGDTDQTALAEAPLQATRKAGEGTVNARPGRTTERRAGTGATDRKAEEATSLKPRRAGGAGSLQVGREPEEREQPLRVEEVGHPGDAAV